MCYAFRVALFFPLGNSLSPLLDFQVHPYGMTCFQSALPERRDLVQDCYKFVTALSQLMEEVEYHFGNAVEKQMVRRIDSLNPLFPARGVRAATLFPQKYLRARVALDGPTDEFVTNDGSSAIARPAICKAGRTVVYHYLQLLLSPVQILPMHQAPCPRLDTYSAARSTPTDRNLTFASP